MALNPVIAEAIEKGKKAEEERKKALKEGKSEYEANKIALSIQTGKTPTTINKPKTPNKATTKPKSPSKATSKPKTPSKTTNKATNKPKITNTTKTTTKITTKPTSKTSTTTKTPSKPKITTTKTQTSTQQTANINLVVKGKQTTATPIQSSVYGGTIYITTEGKKYFVKNAPNQTQAYLVSSEGKPIWSKKFTAQITPTKSQSAQTQTTSYTQATTQSTQPQKATLYLGNPLSYNPIQPTQTPIQTPIQTPTITNTQKTITPITPKTTTPTLTTTQTKTLTSTQTPKTTPTLKPITITNTTTPTPTQNITATTNTIAPQEAYQKLVNEVYTTPFITYKLTYGDTPEVKKTSKGLLIDTSYKSGKAIVEKAKLQGLKVKETKEGALITPELDTQNLPVLLSPIVEKTPTPQSYSLSPTQPEQTTTQPITLKINGEATTATPIASHISGGTEYLTEQGTKILVKGNEAKPISDLKKAPTKELKGKTFTITTQTGAGVGTFQILTKGNQTYAKNTLTGTVYKAEVFKNTENQKFVKIQGETFKLQEAQTNNPLTAIQNTLATAESIPIEIISTASTKNIEKTNTPVLKQILQAENVIYNSISEAGGFIGSGIANIGKGLEQDVKGLKNTIPQANVILSPLEFEAKLIKGTGEFISTSSKAFNPDASLSQKAEGVKGVETGTVMTLSLLATEGATAPILANPILRTTATTATSAFVGQTYDILSRKEGEKHLQPTEILKTSVGVGLTAGITTGLIHEVSETIPKPTEETSSYLKAQTEPTPKPTTPKLQKPTTPKLKKPTTTQTKTPTSTRTPKPTQTPTPKPTELPPIIRETREFTEPFSQTRGSGTGIITQENMLTTSEISSATTSQILGKEPKQKAKLITPKEITLPQTKEIQQITEKLKENKKLTKKDYQTIKKQISKKLPYLPKENIKITEATLKNGKLKAKTELTIGEFKGEPIRISTLTRIKEQRKLFGIEVREKTPPQPASQIQSLPTLTQEFTSKRKAMHFIEELKKQKNLIKGKIELTKKGNKYIVSLKNAKYISTVSPFQPLKQTPHPLSPLLPEKYKYTLTPSTPEAFVSRTTKITQPEYAVFYGKNEILISFKEKGKEPVSYLYKLNPEKQGTFSGNPKDIIVINNIPLLKTTKGEIIEPHSIGKTIIPENNNPLYAEQYKKKRIIKTGTTSTHALIQTGKHAQKPVQPTGKIEFKYAPTTRTGELKAKIKLTNPNYVRTTSYRAVLEDYKPFYKEKSAYRLRTASPLHSTKNPTLKHTIHTKEIFGTEKTNIQNLINPQEPQPKALTPKRTQPNTKTPTRTQPNTITPNTKTPTRTQPNTITPNTKTPTRTQPTTPTSQPNAPNPFTAETPQNPFATERTTLTPTSTQTKTLTNTQPKTLTTEKTTKLTKTRTKTTQNPIPLAFSTERIADLLTRPKTPIRTPPLIPKQSRKPKPRTLPPNIIILQNPKTQPSIKTITKPIQKLKRKPKTKPTIATIANTTTQTTPKTHTRTPTTLPGMLTLIQQKLFQQPQPQPTQAPPPPTAQAPLPPIIQPPQAPTIASPPPLLTTPSLFFGKYKTNTQPANIRNPKAPFWERFTGRIQ